MKISRYWLLCVVFTLLLSACGRSQDSWTSRDEESLAAAGTESETETYAPDGPEEEMEAGAQIDQEADRLYFLNGNDISVNEDGGLTRVQSDCIVLRSNGQYGMIDTGLDGFGGVQERLTQQLQVLAQENGGQISLDFLIITHAHMDHGGYFAELFDENPYVTLSEDCRIL